MSSSAATAEAAAHSSESPSSGPENGSSLPRKDPPARPSVGPPRPTTANVAPVLPPRAGMAKVKQPAANSPGGKKESPPAKSSSIPVEQPLKATPPLPGANNKQETDEEKAQEEEETNNCEEVVVQEKKEELAKSQEETQKNKPDQQILKKTLENPIKTLPSIESPPKSTPMDKETTPQATKEDLPKILEPSPTKKTEAVTETKTTPAPSSTGEAPDALKKKESPSGKTAKTTASPLKAEASPQTKKPEEEPKEQNPKEEEEKASSSSKDSTEDEEEPSSSSPPLKLPELKPKIAVKRKRASLASPKSKEPPTPLRESKRSRVQVIQFQSPNPELQQIIRSFKGGNKEKDTIKEEAEVAPPAPEKTVAASTPNKKVSSASEKYSDAVFFKGEHLAVRNAEGSFYICQAIQNIFRHSKKIRIQWLSEAPEDNPDKDVFIPEYYDKTDFETILTSVEMEKLDKKRFRLTKVEEARIKNILKKSVEKEEGTLESNDVDISEDNPDGLDISLYKDEDQLKELERKKRLEERRMKKPSSSPPSKTPSKKTSKKSNGAKKAKPSSGGSSIIKKSNAKTQSSSSKKTNGSRKGDSRSPRKRRKNVAESEEEDDDEFFEIMPTPKKRRSEPAAPAAVESAKEETPKAPETGKRSRRKA